MKQIQEWLGHSTYNITTNSYTHLEFDSKIMVADALNATAFGKYKTAEPEMAVNV